MTTNPTLEDLRKSQGLFERSAVMPRPIRKRPQGPNRELEIEQRAGVASLHPDLPDTPVWTYDGLSPGPVIVVRAGDRVHATHRHDIVGTIPYRHVVVDDDGAGTMNDAGYDCESTDLADVAESDYVADLHAHTVVHLHGAATSPDSDGWAENVIDFGQEKRDDYVFPRETWPMSNHDGSSGTAYRSGAAPMYWYHDHAMGATRLNVYAGLAGAWLVRDPIEHLLGLPVEEEREIPLVLMDRNFDTADHTADGALSGVMLHKVQKGVREAFAPVNMVNGLIWPRCEVSRRVHRLRVLNGSNARTYRLHFFAQTDAEDLPGTPVPPAAIQQIGTDGGLLGSAIELPRGELILSPGERADVLVDFGLLQDEVTHVVVWNSAPAPWGGSPLNGPVDTSDAGGFLITPHVMRFDLQCGRRRPHLRHGPIAGMALDPEFRRITTEHADLPDDHGHTIVALLEEEEVMRDDMGMALLDGAGNVITHPMLFLHEMVDVTLADRMGCNLYEQWVDGVDPGDPTKVASRSQRSGIRLTLPHDATTYVTCGKRFNDTTMTMATQGAWHVWKVLNLSPDTHPFHVHLTQFQAVKRELLTPDAGAFDPGQQREIDFGAEPVPGVLDGNELGWKDTFRVNPGDRPQDLVASAEMVTFMGNFGAHAGRYVYHCHILEHEDMEMMRQLVVLPGDLMAFMGHHHH